MSKVAAGQHQNGMVNWPALSARQSWRPLALRGTALLLKALNRRNRWLEQTITARLSWTEALSRRLAPWSALPLELRAERPTSLTARAPVNRCADTSRPLSKARDGVAVQTMTVARPAVRLAIMREPGRDGVSDRSLPPAVPRLLADNRRARSLPVDTGITELPLVDPVISAPRSESAYRSERLELPAHAQPRMLPVVALRPSQTDSGPLTSFSPEIAPTAPAALAAPVAPGAVEMLLAQSGKPIPGLELRLLRQESAGAGPPPPASKAEADDQGSSAPPVQMSVPAPLDINTVADRVYQTLMRRQQLERERRGLF